MSLNQGFCLVTLLTKVGYIIQTKLELVKSRFFSSSVNLKEMKAGSWHNAFYNYVLTD